MSFHWQRAVGIFWTAEQYDTEIQDAQDASLMTFHIAELQMYHPLLSLEKRSFYYTCMQITEAKYSSLSDNMTVICL